MDYENEDIFDICYHDFSNIIRERGIEYHESGNIISCYKTGDDFIAKVKGSSEYKVNIRVDIENDFIDYDCTCPCTYPCKHIYAVMLAINNGEYTIVDLKPYISKQAIILEEIIKIIPADEIKNYLLSSIGKDMVVFEINSFTKNFNKYLPNLEYEYYYNNLYNALIIKDEPNKLVNEYLENIKVNISSKEFNEGFKIIKVIIEAYNDSNRLNELDYLTTLFPTMGMFLRVINRKSNDELKTLINKWCNHLKENNYYNNYYLEDIILGI